MAESAARELSELREKIIKTLTPIYLNETDVLQKLVDAIIALIEADRRMVEALQNGNKKKSPASSVKSKK